MFAQIKCFCMLNVFERGCSRLFPGTKILKIDSVAEENARREVGAVAREEIISQIGKFQSSIIAKPFCYCSQISKNVANVSRCCSLQLHVERSLRLLNRFSKFWYLGIAESILFQKHLARKSISFAPTAGQLRWSIN